MRDTLPVDHKSRKLKCKIEAGLWSMNKEKKLLVVVVVTLNWCLKTLNDVGIRQLRGPCYCKRGWVEHDPTTLSIGMWTHHVENYHHGQINPQLHPHHLLRIPTNPSILPKGPCPLAMCMAHLAPSMCRDWWHPQFPFPTLIWDEGVSITWLRHTYMSFVPTLLKSPPAQLCHS